MDHVALFLNFFRGYGDAARPIAQYQYTRVKGRLALCADIGDVVHRTVDACIGVEAAAILHTDRLQIFSHRASGEVFRAIEGHVLQEVSQTLLRVILLDGTHTLGNVEVGLFLRGVVVTQIVRQAIIELADTDTVVNGNLRHLHLLLGRCQSCTNQGYCHK